jgi:2-keto-4-pentenoate hydratase/2-oxohepta-3-ene-1,7-dioic acid hydratase in catechol pathway
MKLANHAGRAVIVTGDGSGVDVERASDGRFGPDVPAVYEAWESFVAWAGGGGAAVGGDAAGAAAGAAVALDPAQLGPPSPQPRQVFGIGLNYRAHAAETGQEVPRIPATFTKFPTCITGPFAEVALPSDTVDWEIELVVVIGRAAFRVVEADAWGHVAGVTVGQDLSERVVQRAAGGQFSLGKSYPGFAPTGPWLVTPDELPDPDDLGLRCTIDGEVVQDARTGDMIVGVPGLVRVLSDVVALQPGDVIFTGTPAGVGVARDPRRFLAPGQVVESWIEGIGTMRTTLVADSA